MPRTNNRDFDSQLVAISDPSSSYTSAYASVNASASTYVDPRVLNGVLEAPKGLGALHVMSHYSRSVHDVANPFGGRRRLPEDSIQIERSGQRSISLPPRASGGASYGGGGGSSGLDITSMRQQIHQGNHRATDKHLTEMDIDAIGMNNREEEREQEIQIELNNCLPLRTQTQTATTQVFAERTRAATEALGKWDFDFDCNSTFKRTLSTVSCSASATSKRLEEYLSFIVAAAVDDLRRCGNFREAKAGARVGAEKGVALLGPIRRLCQCAD